MLPEINLAEYTYELPSDKIAFFPLEKRDESKLLIVDKIHNCISHNVFKEIPNLLPPNSAIFVNSSKVLFARILAAKTTGGKAEIFLTEPIEPTKEYNLALSQENTVKWKCIVGGKKINSGDTLVCIVQNKRFEFKIVEKKGNDAVIEFNPSDIGLSVRDLLNAFGQVPLPPYIKRENIEDDKSTYQTVYARLEGSVAAPTAGLHFTKELIGKLKNSGLPINELTLHVGLGTFKPIDTDNLNEFDMHSERIILKKEDLYKIHKALKLNRNIAAVGTTSVRILETVYWIGVKLIENPNFIIQEDNNIFEQDFPYQKEISISPEESINELMTYMGKNNLEELTIRTKLLIVPGYNFRIVNIMITNFHQPHSTLILLVAAFLGKELWKNAYNTALESEYRFLSYGDANLLIRKIIE